MIELLHSFDKGLDRRKNSSPDFSLYLHQKFRNMFKVSADTDRTFLGVDDKILNFPHGLFETFGKAHGGLPGKYVHRIGKIAG